MTSHGVRYSVVLRECSCCHAVFGCKTIDVTLKCAECQFNKSPCAIKKLIYDFTSGGVCDKPECQETHKKYKQSGLTDEEKNRILREKLSIIIVCETCSRIKHFERWEEIPTEIKENMKDYHQVRTECPHCIKAKISQ